MRRLLLAFCAAIGVAGVLLAIAPMAHIRGDQS
jgi:hypothetical protein